MFFKGRKFLNSKGESSMLNRKAYMKNVLLAI